MYCPLAACARSTPSSSLVLANNLESCEKATLRIYLVRRVMVRVQTMSLTFQRPTMASLPPVANRLPSGEKQKSTIGPVWPGKDTTRCGGSPKLPSLLFGCFFLPPPVVVVSYGHTRNSPIPSPPNGVVAATKYSPFGENRHDSTRCGHRAKDRTIEPFTLPPANLRTSYTCTVSFGSDTTRQSGSVRDHSMEAVNRGAGRIEMVPSERCGPAPARTSQSLMVRSCANVANMAGSFGWKRTFSTPLACPGIVVNSRG